ncbi:uncharacterized protein LOC124809973 isoform X2 [Hydra vulgaris]|uniref:uncharacterized protein LOC124809973 isoform X2 n=1 Tax=Hydra vulgaris TaxID=6087 RepID=UPI0032E9DE17
MLKNENSFDLHQCNSIQEFHDFDQSLLDQDIAKNVKQKLSNIGGLTCSAIAKGMLSKAGTNKLSFRKTNLMKILCDCLPDSYSEKDLQNAVGSILKHAPDRKEGGGRQKSIFGYEQEEE